MSAVLTLRALAMSLMVTEAKLRSAKRSSEAVRNLSRALRSSRLGLAGGAALRTVLTLRFLRSISLLSSWVIRPFSDFIQRPSAAACGDLAGMTAIPATLTPSPEGHLHRLWRCRPTRFYRVNIDLKSGCECDAIHLTRTCISQTVKATLFCY